MASLNKTLFKNKKVLVATFSPWIGGRRLPTNGSFEPLRDYFKIRVKKLVMIDQVMAGSETVMPKIEIYQKDQKSQTVSSSPGLYLLYPLLKFKKPIDTPIIFKIRDFFSVVDWCLRDRSRYDYFIGLESVNALAGILMKKFGFIRNVIYYISDYAPDRYRKKWFNHLYLALDRFCAVHADFIWDVSRAMQPARIKAGLNKTKSAQVIHVPNGLFPDQLGILPPGKIIPFSLVYFGTLGEINGVELVLEAMPHILKKYPRTIFHVIGGPEIEIRRLKKKMAELKLSEKVRFYGFIQDNSEVSAILRKFKVSIVPYPDIPGSPRLYADANKIRAYAGAGLPIVTTYVPPLGRVAARRGAAILVNDKAEDIARAVIKIFSTEKLYLKLRKASIDFARGSLWENSFDRAFADMMKINKNS